MAAALCNHPNELVTIAHCLVKNGVVELIMEALRSEHSCQAYVEEILCLATNFGPTSRTSACRDQLVAADVLGAISEVSLKIYLLFLASTLILFS